MAGDSSIVRRLFNRFFRFLQDAPPEEPTAEQRAFVKTETSKILPPPTEEECFPDFEDAATDVYHLKEIQEDLSSFWWFTEGTATEEEHAVFEAIDNARVCGELKEKIARNEFPLIEIPDTVMQTMRILNNPEFDFLDVANLINRSPALAGEFLKIANSSLYRRGVDIQDLKLALPRLGKDNIKAMLFVYSSKLSLADNPLFNDLAIGIVNHSYATALIAGYLSQRFYPDPDGAFLAGLLHDIGKLGILKAVSKMYDLPDTVDFTMKEEVFDNIFPGLHEQAGLFLGRNWKLNKTVLSAIRHHHDFWETTFTDESQLELHLSAIVNLADSMARILGIGRAFQEKTNLYELPAALVLDIERSPANDRFFEDIPKIVEFKIAG
jgi:HD-like signal output (HDOD) protein